jgi:hypothetical protein
MMGLTNKEVESAVLWSQERIQWMESALETILVVNEALVEAVVKNDEVKHEIVSNLAEIRKELEDDYARR